MDSYGFDDLEMFIILFVFIIVGIDLDRLQIECLDGEEVMEDEDKDDEWKFIMFEVSSLILFIE